MAQWLRRLALSRAAWVQFQQGVETLCSPEDTLCGTEPVSALTRSLLHCCTLYIFSSFFLGFSQWQPHADRGLT